MKKNFLLLCTVAIAALSGCTGTYKSTQTPDDVYYSPAKGGPAADEYEDYTASTDENYLRMKVKNHYRWSSIDDYAYWNDSRYLSNNYYYSDLYNYNWLNNYGASNPYAGWYGYYGSCWNSWYNPYYTVVYYKNPQTYKAFSSSGSNLSAFSNNNYNNSNQLYLTNTKGYNNSNSTNNNTNFGSLVRKVFSSGDNNSGNSSWNTPARTFSSNNSGNNSSSSSPAPSSSAGGSSGGYGSSGGGTGARPSRN
jgi:hypothetical protein